MEHWAKTEEEAENQFQRLPDDVVMNIFNKVSDAKWLCRCWVVSKRFSSLIPLVKTLSIKTNASDFLCMSRNVSDLEFFAQLTQIRSLNLDLVSGNDSVSKWGAKLATNLNSLTLFYAASLSKMKESEQEEDDGTENGQQRGNGALLAFEGAKEAMMWLRIFRRLIPKYPMLESITITDSMNKGVTLCLVGEKFVECKNAFRSVIQIPEEAVPRAMEERFEAMPVLQLPKSGYVMKRVAIVDIILSSGDDSKSYAHFAMVDAFAEQQSVFSEAMVQFLKNYRSWGRRYRNI